MTTKQQNYQDRIVSLPGVVGGKPVVKGTRIPVELVLQYLAAEPDIIMLFKAFPHLTRDDVQACLAFAQEVIAELAIAVREQRLLITYDRADFGSLLVNALECEQVLPSNMSTCPQS